MGFLGTKGIKWHLCCHPFHVVALILLVSGMELLIISSEFEWKQGKLNKM